MEISRTMNSLQPINDAAQSNFAHSYSPKHFDGDSQKKFNLQSNPNQQSTEISKSSEISSFISNHFSKRKRMTGQRQKNIKSTKNVDSANQRSNKTMNSTETVPILSNNFQKRKKANKLPQKQKSTGGEADCHTAESPLEPKLDKSDIKFIWDVLDRSIILDNDQTPESLKNILRNEEDSETEIPKLNGSVVSLTKETTPTDVDSLSSSYDFDESILKNVSEIEETSMAKVSNFNEYKKPRADESISRHVHSLSSSCEGSSFNTERNSPDIIDSIVEESFSDRMVDTSVLESSTKKANDGFNSKSSVFRPAETNKDPDEMISSQAAIKSSEAEMCSLGESKVWDCEELEESFYEVVDDVEKFLSSQEAQPISPKHCLENSWSTTGIPVTNTPKKRNPQWQESADAASPTKKEKFSPHLMKSPKKYFGTSAKRKLIKEHQNDSPSSSFKTKKEGLQSVPAGSQKLISQYFIRNGFNENAIGTKLKESNSQEQLNSTSAANQSDRIGEENNSISHTSSVYLKIFEDCLEHILKVILPVEGYLLDESEITLLHAVSSLNSSAKCLYFRLLDRKHYWIKKFKINYEDLNPSLNRDLEKLEAMGLLSSDYTNEDIHVILQLLNICELKKLCRSFKVGEQGKKLNLILNLTKMSEKQSTLDGKRDSHYLIRKQLASFLNCVKLTPKPRETILKCLRIYSFSYEKEVEEKLVQSIVNNHFNVNFPKFTVKHAVVFHNKQNFDDYEKSLQLLSLVLSGKPSNQETIELIELARISFEQCLNTESNRRILKESPDYLVRFTAANVYAGIVFNNIKMLKKDKNDLGRMNQVVTFLEKLIEERVFLSKKRGQIYDALIRIYCQKKDYSKAFSTFQKAREDNLLSEVTHFSLLAQMKPLLKRKAVAETIKSKLQAVFNMVSLNCINIQTTTVLAKSISSDGSNRKKVYVTENEDGTLYQSVEELVVIHFKKSGWYGVHDEGSLLKNIIIACFWDVIFCSPTLESENMSVFVSRCQMRPLDWGTRNFYSRRKSAIQERLKVIECSDWKAVYNTVNECINSHAGESFNKSIWKWLKYENLRNIEGLLMCLPTKFIASMADWLLQDFATYSSGFPDCTLWNRSENKCLFVEVKSPCDTLAKHQEFWLKKIEEFGGSSLICHVKEIASCASRLNS